MNSSVESGDPVLILKRAYCHVAQRDMTRRMWHDEFRRIDRSVYPLTWVELTRVGQVITSALQSCQQ